MSNENNKPKPHPHAELIKAWADGATIQFYSKSEQKWLDAAWNHPSWVKDEEYRIKPEENKPWKPKLTDKYFLLDVFEGEIRVKYYIWDDCVVDNALYRNHNCFRTKEEAEAAIPRVKDALRGTTNVDSNVDSNVGSNVGSEIDGKPLTDGEIALIQTLRKARIKDIPKYAHSVLVYEKEGETRSMVSQLCVAFTTDGLASGIGTEDAIIDALKKIKDEQEEKQ